MSVEKETSMDRLLPFVQQMPLQQQDQRVMHEQVMQEREVHHLESPVASMEVAEDSMREAPERLQRRLVS